MAWVSRRRCSKAARSSVGVGAEFDAGVCTAGARGAPVVSACLPGRASAGDFVLAALGAGAPLTGDAAVAALGEMSAGDSASLLTAGGVTGCEAGGVTGCETGGVAGGEAGVAGCGAALPRVDFVDAQPDTARKITNPAVISRYIDAPLRYAD